ncbi:MAG: flagellar biosynthetic protein FliR [Verrucomicrobiota bacterium]
MDMHVVSTWLLVFARVGALLSSLPVVSMKEFPVKLRVLFGVMIAILLAPFLPVASLETLSLWSVVRLLVTEVAVGLLLGFVCRFIFFALDTAGNIVGTEMGLSMTGQFNPLTNSQSPVPGMILYWMAVMLWFSLDLHHWMIAALQRSYLLVPVGGAHLSAALFNDILRRTGAIFTVAVQISAPIIGVSFVISLVFSMLGRAVPQMNVFAESFPVRTLIGLMVFGSTSMFMGQHILNYLRRLPEDTLRVMQLIGAAGGA